MPATHSNPDLSVVIPVRNGAAYLAELFARLDGQTLDVKQFEVIIVDDGSTDETPALTQSWTEHDRDRRRMLAGPQRGPAAARNAGWRAARGRFVAFTDADTLPEPDWLEHGLRRLAQDDLPALEGAVTQCPATSKPIHSHTVVNLDGSRFVTANMFYAREVLEAVHGFDESFAQQFLEDSDLAFRVMDEGHDIPFARDAAVCHRLIETDLRGVFRIHQRVRWIPLFARRHPVRYKNQLLPVLRPLSAVELDVLLGLACLAAAPRARGFPRLALAAAAANGLRRGAVSSGVIWTSGRARRDAALLALAVPLWKAFWLAEGSIRFRSFNWLP